MHMSLRSQIVVSVGLIIVMVLAIITIIHIRDLKQNYLEALEWRSEALSQNILERVNVMYQLDAQVGETMLSVLSSKCLTLYEANKAKGIEHVAIISPQNVIVAHNDSTFWQTSIENQRLLAQLGSRRLTTVLDGGIYHTFIPIIMPDETFLGIIDIGITEQTVGQNVQHIILQTLKISALLVILTILALFLLIRRILIIPVKRLVNAGQTLAEGNLSQTFHSSSASHEIMILENAFHQISLYLQDIADVASNIASGTLEGDNIRVRSEYDVLGKSIRNMIEYLQDVARLASRIAEGDLTESVHLRSERDSFGQSIHSMMKGLRNLIVQIRQSAEQISGTGMTIASLTGRDIQIVEEVHSSTEEVISTMRQMGASIEEVAHNMEGFSSSVEETSTSISQMTMSIAHIASNTNNLTEQTRQTREALQETVESLDKLGESTEMSKQLAQDSKLDAQQGQQAVEEVMKSMETIHQTITTAVEAITKFEHRSREIDTILAVIREITEQTSLLALNASIIAAQAGVHGRGFAVVADEIKSLASGVAQSTKDIAQIVQSLQKDTNDVVQTIHEGAQDVRSGIERTHQAQETLQKILKSAEQSSEEVSEIAGTLQTLMASSREVSDAMEQVNLLTDDITRATNEQRSTTEQINQVIVSINDTASQIHRATAEQSDGVHHVIDAMNGVAGLIEQNLESSRQIGETTGSMSSQAELLLHSVARFKLGTTSNSVTPR